MKPYEKPKLIALSLEGNERLCGDCAQSAIKISSDPAGFYNAFALFDQDGDRQLEKSEFEGLFADSEGCKNKPAFSTDFYCKFNAAMTVAWS